MDYYKRVMALRAKGERALAAGDNNEVAEVQQELRILMALYDDKVAKLRAVIADTDTGLLQGELVKARWELARLQADRIREEQDCIKKLRQEEFDVVEAGKAALAAHRRACAANGACKPPPRRVPVVSQSTMAVTVNVAASVAAASGGPVISGYLTDVTQWK